MVRVGPAGWRLHKKGLNKYMYVGQSNLKV